MNMSLSGLCTSLSKHVCSLYQKCSVNLKYAKNVLAAGDPAGGAHDAPQTLVG